MTKFLNDKLESGVTLTSVPANGSTVGTLTQVDITFSKPVTGAAILGNYTLSGVGAASLSIANASLLSGFTYRLQIAGTVSNGTITISLAGIKDSDGNPPVPSSISFTGNIANPTFTASPIAATTINSLTSITLNFSTSVNGAATSGNYVITNAAGGTLAVSSVTGSGAGPYTINLTGVVGNGAISIAINNVTDSTTGLPLAGGPLTYTADTTLPTVAISTAVSNPTNISPFTVTFTFSENVTGFTVADITVGNGSVGNFQITSAQVYTADITPAGVATVTIDVVSGVAQDAAGNNNTAAAQLSRSYDNVQPTVTITSAAPTNTNTSPIPITITFSKTVTGFTVGDITVGNATLSNFSGSGTTYTVDATPSAQGTVTIDIAAGVASDSAGNTNTSATQLSRTYDSTAPSLTPNPTQNSAVGTVFNMFEVTFSETVNAAASLTTSYTASGPGKGSWSTNPTAVTQNGGGCGTNCYQLVFSGSPADGSLVITLSGIQDSAGNNLSGATVNYVGGWTKHKKLTIDNSAQAQNLVNFPLMVRVDGTRITYGNTQNSGEDIRFYDADGITLLPHEVELWNEAGSSYVWVKVPQIDASSNTDYIWMYYGNPTALDGQNAAAVWDTNFKTVLHLAAGSFTDSSTNANNGVNMGSTDSSGKMAGGKGFDGSTNYITTPTSGMSPTQGTVYAWAYPTTALAAGTQGYIFEHKSNSCLNNDRINLLMRNNNPPSSALNVSMGELPHTTTTTGTMVMNAWNFVVLTWNSGTYNVYLNGVDVTSGGTYTNFATLETTFNIGWNHCQGQYWGGNIDEVRISNTVRSSPWIAAEYKSMDDTYLTFGPEL
ncbi:MAG: hypothetical protein LDLANPLL_01687 [Turneriella sp.]|nr:hypothetical protein [Turneriella sp.]